MNIDHKQDVLTHLRSFINDPITSDTKILVGRNKKIFNAHSFILASRSPILKKQLFESVPSIRPPESPSADPESFRDFLEYLYTGSCTVSLKNAIYILYLANCYDFKVLMESCVKFVKEHLTVENVLEILEWSLLCSEQSLIDACWDIIDTQTEKVTLTESFKERSVDTVVAILKRDSLHIEEVKLFEGVMAWAKVASTKTVQAPKSTSRPTSATSTTSSISTTEGNSLKNFLEPVLQYIRFPLMNSKQLVEVVKPLELLTTEVYVEALEYNVAPEKFDQQLPQFHKRFKKATAATSTATNK